VADGQTSYVLPAPVSVSATATASVPVTIQTTGSGTLASIEVLTQGAANLDFTAIAGGSCAAGPVTRGQSCTVQVKFQPAYPGLRTGAIVLVDSTGTPVATEYLAGSGLGPLAVMETGELITVAGNGHLANSGDPTMAGNASIHEPQGTAVDGAGNLYYTDSGNNVIRKVDTTGKLTTVAGTGTAGLSPDGTIAIDAMIDQPSGIALDGAGNIFFSDNGNNAVREVVASSGKIVTIAGDGQPGYTGDGGVATAAELYSPEGLAFDTSGNLYIADALNNVVREVTAADGKIKTIAGTGNPGFSGDLGPATSAMLQSPWGVHVAPSGVLYIADFGNNAVRAVTAGTIATVVGTAVPGYTGDGGLATLAQLNRPTAVAMDAAGNLFIADSENNCVRKVHAGDNLMSTVAGDGIPGYDADGQDSNVSNSQLNKTYSVTLDSMGNMFIADRIGLRIREVLATVGAIQYQPVKVTNVSPASPQEIEDDGNMPLTLASMAAVSNAAIDPATTTCKLSSPIAVDATCTIGVEFAPTVVGSPVYGQITVTDDSPNSPMQIEPFGNSLSIFPTATTVSSAPNPSSLGAAVTLTASVSSTNTNPISGTVSFYDGSTLLGGAPQILNSTASQATLTIATLSLGSHNITAVYSGDSGDAASTSPVYVQVVEQATGTVLTGTPNPSSVQQKVTFTATVSPANTGGTTPGGTVTFSSDGSLLPNGTVALAGGVASYSTALLVEGTHTITAVYSGDATDLSSTSNSYLQTVNFAGATTSVASSNLNATVTTPVTFTATVTGNVSSAATGTVEFKDGATVIGSGSLNGSGVASFTDSSLATGSYVITAVYEGDNNYAASTSTALTQTIVKVDTTVTVASNTNPAVAGAVVNFTVNVIAAMSTTPNLPVTGTVTLLSGSTTIGTGTLTASGSGPATAIVTIPVTSLAPGASAITAAYDGNTNYSGATSTPVAETVVSGVSSTALSASAATVVATKPVILTAAVSSNGGTPSGNVVFKDGANVVGTGTLNASGVATATVTTLAVGSHTIVATYSGDTDDTASTSNAVTIVVQAATTVTSLTASPNPSDYGQAVTLSAAVSGNGATPTGSVTFFDGATVLQTVTLGGTTATYATTTLSDGVHSLTAVYNADTNDGTSTSAPVSVKVLQTVSLSVTSTSPNPSSARANVHFVATLTPLQGIQPTGAVTFLDGATVLGTGTLSGMTATFDTTSLSVGTHQIVASYAGDTSTETLTSATFPFTVNADGSSVTLTASANPATFGTPVTLTAAVSASGGALSGTVIFEDGGTTIGQGTVTNGVAVFTTSSLSAGVHSIVAAYQGDSDDLPTTSAALPLTVERATSTTVASSVNPALSLAPFTITATVANGGTVVPTGNVSFAVDGASVGSAPVNSLGVATLAVASLPVGTHNYIATYSGDAVDFASVSAPFQETVQLRPTTDVLTSSATSLTGGQQVTLISVIDYTGPVAPTGTVSFTAGSSPLATAAVNAQGVAAVTVLLSGTSASVSSAYSGDANYAASVSGITTITIVNAPTFTIASNPSAISMPSKDHTTLTITLTSLDKFSDTFNLGCLGLPYATTCTFSQNNQLTLPAGGSQSITVTVDTGNPLGAGAQARVGDGGWGRGGALACFVPGCFLLGLAGLRMRRFRALAATLMLLTLVVASSALSGCGSLNVNGTPPGTYQFQVNAVGESGISQAATVSMTITP
jgi:hypothetical protein